MPNRKTHGRISRIILGKSYPKIDATLDLPVKIMGPHHRRILHTVPESFIVGLLLTGDIRSALAGSLHILIDATDSTIKKETNNLLKKTEAKKIYGKNKKEKQNKK
jgi:hypothetical protein